MLEESENRGANRYYGDRWGLWSFQLDVANKQEVGADWPPSTQIERFASFPDKDYLGTSPESDSAGFIVYPSHRLPLVCSCRTKPVPFSHAPSPSPTPSQTLRLSLNFDLHVLIMPTFVEKEQRF
uniref:Uncharacterized protein n=1 Tax=Physcomitrium patens TaxID=3218 RepID=A0A2K1J9P2_PHYPA|nr:hypothetical protein PHYPA_021340 [Physcomitrium patens]